MKERKSKFYRDVLAPYRTAKSSRNSLASENSSRLKRNELLNYFIEEEYKSEIEINERILGDTTIINDQHLERADLHPSEELQSQRLAERTQNQVIPDPPGSEKVLNITDVELILWKQEFLEQFPNDSLKFEIKTGGTEATLKEPEEELPPIVPTQTRVANKSARMYLSAHVKNWLSDKRNQVLAKKWKFKSNQWGCAHMDWLKKRFPQIGIICQYRFVDTNVRAKNKKKVNGFVESEETFLSSLGTYLNYAMFVLNKIHARKDFFKYFTDVTYLKSYCNALEDIDRLKYESPNTRRRKLEAIATVLNYLSENDSINHELTFQGKVRHAKIYLNGVYKRTNSTRDQWLNEQHSQSKLEQFGKYMNKDRFWTTIQKSYHICLAWTKWYFYSDKTSQQKKKFIKKNGQQFMDNFTFWLFVYSYSNRSQVYYQSMAKDVKPYKFKNPVTGDVYY